MRDLITNFYLKKSVIIIAFICSIVAWISWSVTTFIAGEYKLGVFGLIFAIITAAFFIVYARGETSIQKLLFGSLFIFLIIDTIEILFVYAGLIDVIGPVYTIFTSVILADLVVLFICHILQQSDHVGHGISGIVAQCCGLFMILWIAFLIYMIACGLVIPSDYTFTFSIVFTTFMLICVETRIRKYKQIRTELKNKNEWNEVAREEAKKLFKL